MQISWFSCLGSQANNLQHLGSQNRFFGVGQLGSQASYSQHLDSQCRYLDSAVWEAKPTMFNHLGSQNRFFGQLGSLASFIVSILAAYAASYLDSVVFWKPSLHSSTSWPPKRILWSAGKPSQLYSQHLSSQCRYLDSVVWEAQANNLQHLGSHGRFFGQLGSQASYTGSILACSYLDSVVWEAKPYCQLLGSLLR